MRTSFLLAIILFTSCETQKDKMANRQEAVRKEIDQVKAMYFKKTDSLDMIKKADTSWAKQQEIAEALVAAEKEKNIVLIPLQKEYDSLEVVLKKK